MKFDVFNVTRGLLFLLLILPGTTFGQSLAERTLALRGAAGGSDITQFFTADVTGGGGVTGRAEYKVLTDGNREFSYYLLVSDVPNDTTLSIEVDNAVADQAVVTAGQIGGFLRTPETVPPITANSVVTVKRGTQVLGTGTFQATVVRPFNIHVAEGTGSKVLPPTTSEAVATGLIFFDEASTLAEVLVFGTGFSDAPQSVSLNGPAAADQNGPPVFTFDNVQSFPTDGTVLFLARGFVQLTPTFRGLLNEGLLYLDVRTPQFPSGEVRGQFGLYTPNADFEGDGVTDISVYRPSDGVWYFLNSSNQQARSIRFGQAGDRIVPGDYDGDEVADLAVFQRSGDYGVWRVRCSSDGRVTTTQWGLQDDIPVVADFDADGSDDLTVFRPSNGTWYIRRMSDVIKPRTQELLDNEVVISRWGQAGDVPFASDFDGDGSPDLTVYRPSNGTWYIQRSSDGGVIYRQWGLASDIPLVGDFDGTGRADIGVFRPSNGTWYLLNGLNDASYVRFGLNGDVPTTGDYDGDGQTDITVFRPSNGTWYGVTSSNDQFFASRFGQNGDQPTAGR